MKVRLLLASVLGWIAVDGAVAQTTVTLPAGQRTRLATLNYLQKEDRISSSTERAMAHVFNVSENMQAGASVKLPVGVDERTIQISYAGKDLLINKEYTVEGNQVRLVNTNDFKAGENILIKYKVLVPKRA